MVKWSDVFISSTGFESHQDCSKLTFKWALTSFNCSRKVAVLSGSINSFYQDFLSFLAITTPTKRNGTVANILEDFPKWLFSDKMESWKFIWDEFFDKSFTFFRFNRKRKKWSNLGPKVEQDPKEEPLSSSIYANPTSLSFQWPKL